jgi:DNA-binding CsgD family transcriptional regulator
MQDLTNIYPFNLARDIFFGNKEEAVKIYIPSLFAALETLTERERDVLIRRYCGKMTLRAIGDIHGVTPSRIRENEAKALRKMRHPSRANTFKAVPLAEKLEQKSKYQRLNEDYERLREAYNRLKEDYEAYSNKLMNPNIVIPTAEATTLMQTPIAELELSVRSYNCLRRAGKDTLQDIVQMTEGELRGIRNLGGKSALEILSKVKEYGLQMRTEDDES